MGNQVPVKDTALPDLLPLPCDDAVYWDAVKALIQGAPVKSIAELSKRVGVGGWPGGLAAALGPDAGLQQKFFDETFPYIVQLALALPELRTQLPNGELPFLRQGVRRQLRLKRTVGASLLANMFLCTFDKVYSELPGREALPDPSFKALHQDDQPQEVAKLEMFINFFERLAQSGAAPGTAPEGFIVIDRVVGVALGKAEWLTSEKPLLPMEMAPKRQGFEAAPDLAHADFANMFIGGGVLCGGCVQEEIRFAICPELCLSMLVCPCMLEAEAIQVLGGEQFSAYSGYARGLRYAGDHRDSAPRAADGTVLVSILAMDALDLRGGDNCLDAQMSTKNMLRDLNKSLAAFTPVDTESLERFSLVATGNWGCGAFGGCAELKALLQWASASQCGRRLRYFPFDLDIGDELTELTSQAMAKGVTVGKLLSLVWALQKDSTDEEPTDAEERTVDLPTSETKRPKRLDEPEARLQSWELFKTIAGRF